MLACQYMHGVLTHYHMVMSYHMLLGVLDIYGFEIFGGKRHASCTPRTRAGSGSCHMSW